MYKIKQIENSTRILDRVLEYTAIIGLTISAALAFCAVVMRYLFGFSSIIVEEICRYSILYGVFAYIGPLVKKGEHLTMSMLTDRLTGKRKTVNSLIVNILLFVSFAYLCWSGFNWALSLYTMKVQTMSGSMPMVIPTFAIPLGMFFGAVYSLLEIVLNVMRLMDSSQTSFQTTSQTNDIQSDTAL